MPLNLSVSSQLKLTLVPWLCKPTDLPGCSLWFRAEESDLENFPATARVVSWTDRVNHVAVRAAGVDAAPNHLSSARELNGLPGVAFEDDAQGLLQYGELGALPWSESPFSLFAVCAPENAGEVNGMVALWAGTLPHAGLRFSSNGEFQAWVESLFGSSKRPRQFKPHVVGVVYDGEGTLRLYLDGKLAATHTGVFVAALDDGEHSVLAIGTDSTNTENFRGVVGDVVVYGRALDEGDLAYLNSALEAHYKMRPSWYSSLATVVSGGARWVANLIGGELRHLFGPAERPDHDNTH